MTKPHYPHTTSSVINNTMKVTQNTSLREIQHCYGPYYYGTNNIIIYVVINDILSSKRVQTHHHAMRAGGYWVSLGDTAVTHILSIAI